MGVRSLFTDRSIGVWRDMVQPQKFGLSFFTPDIGTTRDISFEVVRDGEPIAVDVSRGSAGNYNKATKSTEKIITPAYYREFVKATDVDLYDVAIGSKDPTVAVNVIRKLAMDLNRATNKIWRAKEKQCWDVLETGVVTLDDGTTIDFKRTAASLDDKTATPWTTGTVDPHEHAVEAADLLRSAGKYTGGVINVIMGSTAFNAYMNNDTVQARQDLKSVNLEEINPPQRVADGTLHGQFSAGAYTFRIWTYTGLYDTSSATGNKYMNPKKVVYLPESTQGKFKMAYGAVPQIATSSALKTGQFVFGEKLDEFDGEHLLDVKSCAIAVPMAVDQIVTQEVIV